MTAPHRRSYTPLVHLRPACDVTPEAIAACLAEAAARDLMAVPVSLSVILAADAWVAVDDDDRVLGVGWRAPFGDATLVEVRVRPGCRRQGVGTVIYTHLSAGAGPLLASCDAGQRTVRRFLEHRDFHLEALLFLQRWDGEPADVPRAFRTATVQPPEDPVATLALLDAAHADSWPPHMATSEDLTANDAWARVALVDGVPMGAVVARVQDDCWAVRAFGVHPQARNRGVGRALLTELMAHAAQMGWGVCLRVHHEAEGILAWTSGLGFWTFRTWAYYRRG
jgi:ribosomal protein S18 acetylase RimI-like enzyme